jgi:hypothetical protein
MKSYANEVMSLPQKLAGMGKDVDDEFIGATVTRTAF